MGEHKSDPINESRPLEVPVCLPKVGGAQPELFHLQILPCPAQFAHGHPQFTGDTFRAEPAPPQLYQGQIDVARCCKSNTQLR